MKLSCNRDAFSQMFYLAAAVAALRDVKAVLQNVKMTAAEGVITLMATDLDMSIRLELTDAEISESGEVILPTRLMKSILQASGDETLTMDSDGGKLTLFGDRYKIPTQSPEDFPDVPPFDATAYHEVASSVLRELIRRTQFAIDTENTKYTLGGVLFEFTEGNIAAVATDGRRLANQEGAAQSQGGHFSENSAIVPLKALGLIDKAIGADDAPVRFAAVNGKAAVSCGGMTFTARLVEGRFPRWKNIIPEKAGRARVDLMAGPLLQAVRQAEIVTTDKQPGIFLDFADGTLELSASGAEVGESKISLPVAYSEQATRLKMDPRYLVDFLRGLESEKVVALYMKDDQSVLFETDDGYRYVVMPLS